MSDLLLLPANLLYGKTCCFLGLDWMIAAEFRQSVDHFFKSMSLL